MPFISPEKLFSFSRYLNFCLDFLVTCKNGWIRKISLISKFMTSQPMKQAIAIHIFLKNKKDNQKLKHGGKELK